MDKPNAKNTMPTLTGENYPHWQSCLSGAAATAYAAHALLSRPDTVEGLLYPSGVVAGILGAFALSKAYQARKLSVQLKKITSPDPYFLTYQELLGISQDPAHAHERWIGKGFHWGSSQRQTEKEISKTDWRRAQQAAMTRAAAARYVRTHAVDLFTRPVLLFRTAREKKHRVAISPGAQWLRTLGDEQPQFLSQTDMEGHMAIFGTTGAGKSRFMEIQLFQAIIDGGPVIVLDPKGDKGLQRAMQEACRRSGMPERFMLFHPGFPERSISINPLASFTEIGQLASRIAGALPGQSGEGKTFVSIQDGVLRAIVNGLQLAGEAPTFKKIYAGYLNRSNLAFNALKGVIIGHCGADNLQKLLLGSGFKTQLKALRTFYEDNEGIKSPEMDSVLNLADRDASNLEKTCSTVVNLLQKLTFGQVGDLLSPDAASTEAVPTDLEQIIKRQGVLYVGLDALTDAELARSLGSILLSDLAAIAGARYNFEDASTSVSLFVDEAGELACEPLTQMLNKARGARFRICIATQTVADFISKCDKPADALRILANLNNFIALRCNDPETQRFLTERLEKTTVTSTMRAHGVSTSASKLTAQTGSLSERLVEEETELVSASTLSGLPNCEYFAIVAGGNVIKGRVPVVVNSGSEFKREEC